mmetsp:Transcript_31532/g.35760  ORF Transcript_31532/g.35760 Transcript_31532/m.35760 type:complete len:482 (-) Transcript_31532:306-1751(-)
MTNSRQRISSSIVVHDHDVLCGRGVNIAQHPGNERFRSLINTRHDESYCTNFSTNEKKELALEVVKHVQSLQPPGRFLKRCGKATSSRGLEGPWEALTEKEYVKKTCQALRDCNRNDRAGYGSSVTIPEDVKRTAEELSKSGLSLKEHAAKRVAIKYPKRKTSTMMMTMKKPPPPSSLTQQDTTESPVEARLIPTATAASVPASVSLKKQRTEEEPVVNYSSQHMPTSTAAAGAAGAGYASVDATPTGQSYAAVVPVTNTPGPLTLPFFHEHQGQHQQQQHHHQRMFQESDLILSHGHYNHAVEQSLARSSMGMMAPSQQHPSPMNQHDNHQHLLMADCANSVAMAAIPAPYSPVVWNHSHGGRSSVERPHQTTEESSSPELDDDDDSKIEPIPMSDWKPAYRQNLFDDPEQHPSSHHNRDERLQDQDDTAVPEDLFQSVAATASASFGTNEEEDFPSLMPPRDRGGGGRGRSDNSNDLHF